MTPATQQLDHASLSTEAWELRLARDLQSCIHGQPLLASLRDAVSDGAAPLLGLATSRRRL